MKRSIGVTVIAVLSLLGSALTLLFGALMVIFALVMSPPSHTEFPIPPVAFKALLLLASLMYLLPAVWGIFTSVGLFRLRNWARISIIVFSALLAVMSGFSGLMLSVMPVFPAPSTHVDASVMTAMRIAMGMFWLGLLAIGIWWLVFFNRAKVKQQFVSSGLPLTPPASEIFAARPLQVSSNRPERPLSFTILAWFLLISCLFVPLNLVIHTPAFLFTKLVTGRPAELYYLLLLALHLYIGVGLLRLKPLARSVAVGYYLFLLINAAEFYLAPGSSARMHELFDWEFAVFPWMRTRRDQFEAQFNSRPSFIVGSCMGLVLLAAVLYFLITRKQAFERAAAAKLNPAA